MKRTVAIVCLAGSIGGCTAQGPTSTDRTGLDTGLPETVTDHDVIPASDAARERLGIEEWLVYAVGDEERYALVGLDAEGEAVETVELLGEPTGVTVVLGGTGTLVVDQAGVVVESTLDETQRELLGFAAGDLQRMTAYLAPSRACVIWTGVLLAASAACGAGVVGSCIAIVPAFCNASLHCGNNVCEF